MSIRTEARRQEARRIGHEARKQGDLPAAGRHPSATSVALRASGDTRSKEARSKKQEARRQGECGGGRGDGGGECSDGCDTIS